MTPPTKGRSAQGRTAVASGSTGRLSPAGASLVAWLVPGAGHMALGDGRRAVVLFAVLSLMFVTGLAFGGRLFPFEPAEPLVLLAAVAEWALAIPRAIAGLGGFGRGDVVSETYEYGNTFLIAAGLLNMLVMLDVADRAAGRKGR